MARNITQKIVSIWIEEQRCFIGTEDAISESNCFLNCLIQMRVMGNDQPDHLIREGHDAHFVVVQVLQTAAKSVLYKDKKINDGC